MRWPLLIVVVLHLHLVRSWSPRFIDGIDNQYECNCILRDTESERPPTPAPEPEPELVEEVISPPSIFVPKNYFVVNPANPLKKMMMKEPTYLDRVMSFFRREKREVPFYEEDDVHSESSPSIFKETLDHLGQNLMKKYWNTMSERWNLFDRFHCTCSGDISKIFRAEHYITVKVVHD